MELYLENINKIREATINFNGLTVIAGENDSGKSTIGKVLFTVIKALGDTDKGALSKRDKLTTYVDSLYKRLGTLRSKTSFPMIPGTFVTELLSIGENQSLDDIFLQRKDEIQNLEVEPRIKSLIQKDLNYIERCVREKDSRNETIMADLQYSIESEFRGKICSLNTSASSIKFNMNDEGGNALLVAIEDNDVKDVEVTGDDFVQDATYIESPLYIHLLDALLYAQTFREGYNRSGRLWPMVPYHVADFMSKINFLKYVSEQDAASSNSHIKDSISRLLNGQFAFDEKKKNLVFKRDGLTLSPINVASGIKSFGVIQMLLELGCIDSNRMLIWDEPENHLHPQWQIEFADVLVRLAGAGVPVIISTHSPYFIQGVRYSSARQSMEKYVNYYLNETEPDGRSVFNDVSNDLNRVFIKLAEPLNKVINI